VLCCDYRRRQTKWITSHGDSWRIVALRLGIKLVAEALAQDPAAARPLQTLGAVVIGRNEGDRLKCCLESVHALANRLVYVDSGSRDNSIAIALALGAVVVELDISAPFTAARARNEGFRKLVKLNPDLNCVFFVDGDCEVVSGWLDKASKFLEERRDVAVVWGFRRERFPEKSLYNMLCDFEWSDYPIGETKLCGGDALIRVGAFRQIGGYRADLICGEEPEMCVRLRHAGWRIWRLNETMTLHDAAMYRFGQWWIRMLRGGYGFAQGASLHGAAPEHHDVRESWSAWIWGLGIPLATLFLIITSGWWGILLLGLYPLQVTRLALLGKRSVRENWWRAGALVVCKFPETIGQIKFLVDRLRGVQSRLIEYK